MERNSIDPFKAFSRNILQKTIDIKRNIILENKIVEKPFEKFPLSSSTFFM